MNLKQFHPTAEKNRILSKDESKFKFSSSRNESTRNYILSSDNI